MHSHLLLSQYVQSLSPPSPLPLQVEETVLGQLAWRSNSPLFEAIDAAGSVPSYDDVALPTPPGGRGGASPLLHPRLRTLGGKGEDASCRVVERALLPAFFSGIQAHIHV